VLDGRAERPVVVVDRGLQVANGDGNVVDLGEQHPSIVAGTCQVGETEPGGRDVKRCMDLAASTTGVRRSGMTTTPEPATSDAAAAAFYAAHRLDAARWAVALTGRRDIGEDLAQEALLRTSARLASIDNPAAYLRRTVVNVCRSWMRSASREQRRVDLAHAGRPASVSAAGHELLDSLGRLGYKQRAAVVLRYWADWTDEQIAAALDCRPATVRVLLHRGLAALRAELKEDQ
jgi:RNA polymerase sigma factor (sigma-70 family)